MAIKKSQTSADGKTENDNVVLGALESIYGEPSSEQDDDFEEEEEEEEQEEEEEEEQEEEENEEEENEEEESEEDEEEKESEEEQEEEESEEEEQEEENEEEEEEEEEEDPLGVSKKKPAAQKPMTPEQKKQLAEINKINKTDFKHIAEIKNIVDKAKRHESYAKAIESDLAKLPKPILDAINAFADGKNWKEPLKNAATAPDFNKSFKDHSPEDLLSYYAPAKLAKLKKSLEEETIDDEDYEEKLKDYVELIEDKYEKDKKSYENYDSKIEELAAARKKEVARGVKESTKAFKSEYPSANKQTLAVATELLANPKRLLSVFFDEKGSPKPNAVEKLFFAMENKKIISTFVKPLKSKSDSAAAQELLRKGEKKRTTVTKKSKTSQKEEEYTFGRKPVF